MRTDHGYDNVACKQEHTTPPTVTPANQMVGILSLLHPIAKTLKTFSFCRKKIGEEKYIIHGLLNFRYKTKEEATQVYKAIKAWLQVAYRKHEYQDKCLVWAWRCERYLRMYESGDKSFWTQRNRISTLFNMYIIKAGLMTKKERGISEDLWPAKIQEYLQICRA